MAGELAGIGRRRDAADHRPVRVDHLRSAADEVDAVVALDEGKLQCQPIGPRDVVGVEPREIRRARRGDAEIERRDDAERRSGAARARDHRRGALLRAGHRVVVGSVVDDDELEIAKCLIEHAVDRFAQPSRAVAHRHED